MKHNKILLLWLLFEVLKRKIYCALREIFSFVIFFFVKKKKQTILLCISICKRSKIHKNNIQSFSSSLYKKKWSMKYRLKLFFIEKQTSSRTRNRCFSTVHIALSQTHIHTYYGIKITLTIICQHVCYYNII